MDEFAKIPRDILVVLALEMNYMDILSWCVSSKHVNQNVCKNQDFWRSLLYKRYPSVSGFKSNDYRNLYKLLRETIVSQNPYNKPVFISQEMVEFLRNTDFGIYMNVPISEVLELAISQGILSRPALTTLLTLYLRRIKFRENNTFLKVDEQMNKYLGNTLTELEEEGEFNRNNFTSNKIKRIIAKNILKEGNKKNLEDNKKLVNKITEIVIRFFVNQ